MTDFNRAQVRVTAPASVLYDFEQFQKALQGVLGQTSCPRCTSGMIFTWQEFEDYTVNTAGEVRPVVAPQLAPQLGP